MKPRHTHIVGKALAVVRPRFRLDLHDSRRFDDWEDPMHGQRAPDFAVRLHGDGHIEGDRTVQACCDADRLDLARVGIRPGPGRLCTPYARRPGVIDEAVRLSRGQARAG